MTIRGRSRLVRRLIPVALCVTVVVGLMAAGLPLALAAPATPSFGRAIDAYAAYDGQSRCDSSAKPGVLGVRDLLNATYGTHLSGIGRPCDRNTVSEHYEGRALDYMLNVNNAGERAIANDFLNWLLATDQYGNRHAMARRLGVMYIIWNRQQWRAYRPADGWQPYGGNNPHTDHIHISFSWAGALRQTSWWRGAGGGGGGGTLTGLLPDINQDGKADIIGRVATGHAEVSHGTGADLFAPPVTFGSGWNVYQGIWIADINQDGKNDIIGKRADGFAEVSHGTGRDTFASPFGFGSGWNVYAGVWIVDINQDGKNDIIGKRADGSAEVSHGTGPDTFASPVGFGSGWNVYTAILIADINQDRKNDIIGRRANGDAEVSHGTGPDTFASPIRFGSGWNGYTGVWIADIDQDGKNDIIGRLASGHAVVSHGTGPDTFASAVGFGSGWNVYTFIA